jgi:hypothetical protein
MLSAIQFYFSTCRHLRRYRSRARNLFMHEEKERRIQNRLYSPQTTREVTYKGQTLAVQVFCDRTTLKGNLYVQVLSGPGGTSTNTQHATLTNKNVVGDNYFVRPSHRRCANHRLKRPPRKVGRYPVRVSATKNWYIVGPMSGQLLARVFEVAIAKRDSMP